MELTEDSKVIGTVESNNGNKAFVRFSDGATKWFTREGESKAAFLLTFPIGTSHQAGKIEVNISNRDGLFTSIKAMFSHCKVKYSVSKIENKSTHKFLIGQGLEFPGITVFCAPHCEAAEDIKGKHFALFYPDGSCEWMELNEENFEYACDKIAKITSKEIIK